MDVGEVTREEIVGTTTVNRHFFTQPAKARRRAFSIVELLVAVIIITVLATMAIPIVQNRVDQARLTRAQHEMDALADAENRVEADTGYYVRLFMLNDLNVEVADRDGVATDRPPDPNDVVDGVMDYANPGGFHPLTDRLFIIANSDDNSQVGRLVDTTLGASLLQRLVNDAEAFGWTGTYINWQTDENVYNNIAPANVASPDGIPDDPWGNNYMLITTWGLIPDGDPGWTAGPNGPVTSFALPIGSTSATVVNNLDEVVDRVAIVSLGPNGVPGNGGATPVLGSGDDLIRFVGK